MSEQETAELASLLTDTESPSLHFARGAFAALATAPGVRAPADWLPRLLGAEATDAQLRRLFELLFREHNACLDCLAVGVPAVPRPEEEEQVRDFCKGYVQIAHDDPLWVQSTEAFERTLPLAFLAGYVEPDSLTALEPRAAEAPAQYSSEQRERLADLVAHLFEFMAPKREQELEKAQAPVETPAKIGRNAPCPCGSGKKFKRCCGGSQ